MTAPIEDAVLPTQDLPIRLPVFEGPLDLLLYLIRRNEIDIYDIPIEEVTRQYLAVLREMEQLNLEVAGDFFVMAATLMYIKSRMLLPTNELPVQAEEEEEDADPRWELVQQLLEYKRFKEAAANLRELIEASQDYLPRLYKEAVENMESRPLRKSDKIELWNTFNMVLRRLAESITQGEIHDDNVTVADRMEHILILLQDRPVFRFTELFEGKKYNLNMLVASFLAVLELTRLKKMVVHQDDIFGDITCERRMEEEPEEGENHPESEQPLSSDFD